MNDTFPVEGPFGSIEYGKFWSDENVHGYGLISAIEIKSSLKGKISAIRSRYVIPSISKQNLTLKLC